MKRPSVPRGAPTGGRRKRAPSPSGAPSSPLSKLPFLVASDEEGNVFEIPELRMAAMSGGEVVVPDRTELVPLPPGSDLFGLPGRVPVGIDPETGEPVELPEYRGKKLRAVAAFMAPGWLCLHHAAFRTRGPDAPRLPLFAYTAIGWSRGAFRVAGRRIDVDPRHDPEGFDPEKLRRASKRMLERHPDNRLVRHLVENCVLRYGCPSARNMVLRRWECPIAASAGCNSACVGCISLQEKEAGFRAAHDRISFLPTVDEMVDLAVPHLEKAPGAIVTFGQGCEGEPLLAAARIEEAIRAIRKRTSRGILQMNTNASLPGALDRLFTAGLDSIRASLNSARKGPYETYYRPSGYGFEEVVASLDVARRHGAWISLNDLVFPGFTDTEAEFEALVALARRAKVDMIQTRNLNLDPELYEDLMGMRGSGERAFGMSTWLRKMADELPGVRLGYFNPSKETMGR